jgi:hypothetical protein
MPLLSPNVGEVLLLKYMLNYTAPTNVEIRLYTNNITPAYTDILSSYTESSAAGYAGITLTGTNWTIATSSTTAVANYAQQTFSYTTNESVYGYFVTSNGKGQVLWSERFSGAVPFNIPAGGGTVSITARVTLT